MLEKHGFILQKFILIHKQCIEIIQASHTR